METIILSVKDTNQAKLIIKPDFTIIKIPDHLPKSQFIEVRNKLMKVADINSNTKNLMKVFYRINTPYLFLNSKGVNGKETKEIYTYTDL